VVECDGVVARVEPQRVGAAVAEAGEDGGLAAGVDVDGGGDGEGAAFGDGLVGDGVDGGELEATLEGLAGDGDGVAEGVGASAASAVASAVAIGASEMITEGACYIGDEAEHGFLPLSPVN
jgi:hypothetical protein